MAPVANSVVGMLPPPIDDVELEQLLIDILALVKPNLKKIDVKLVEVSPTLENFTADYSLCQSVSLSDFLSIIQGRFGSSQPLLFNESTNLYAWTVPLNIIDCLLKKILNNHPGLILVEKVGQESFSNDDDDRICLFLESSDIHWSVSAARSLNDVIVDDYDDAGVIRDLKTLLDFLAVLLKHSVNKDVFNSLESLLLLVSAANDDISYKALECLAYLSGPPFLYRQHISDLHTTNTVLHDAKAPVFEFLLALARGWGSRGSGTGLHTCVTYDDSQQQSLPAAAGDLIYEFSDASNSSEVVEITLSQDQINNLVDSSTAGVYFHCLEMLKNKGLSIPLVKKQALVANIRLSLGFKSQKDRIRAVERRLMALQIILNAHPSTDITSGYFHAQPELVTEIADLVRPILSSVSSSSSLGALSGYHDACPVPHKVRILAMDTLNALVSRRDSASGGLSPIAKQTGVFAELGVVKGQYLGLLPTLIRYCLAALSSSFEEKLNFNDKTCEKVVTKLPPDASIDEIGLDLGMAFLEATCPILPPVSVQVEEALEFIIAVITLASAVVNVSSGMVALTECGLISAIVSTLKAAKEREETITHGEKSIESYANALRRYIISECLQVIDTALATHSSSLTSFNEVSGADVLVDRLSVEVKNTLVTNLEVLDTHMNEVNEREDEIIARHTVLDIPKRTHRADASRKAILFNLISCLNVYFHQLEGTANNTSGAQMRKAELTWVFTEILNNSSLFGGSVIAPIVQLLADVMNADPQIVHHVHNSGISKAFLDMLNSGRLSYLAPSSDMIMNIPNILSAMCLTENGVNLVIENNPLPSFFNLFDSPLYAMPRTKCLLNEMTTVVGSSLEELMRHAPKIKPLCIDALKQLLERIISFGKIVIEKEDSFDDPTTSFSIQDATLSPRSYFSQYTTNICQLLEHILRTSDHVSPFVQNGGFERLLELHSLLLPGGLFFLNQVSCLSNTSIVYLGNFKATMTLSMAVKGILSYYPDFGALLDTFINSLNRHLDELAHLANLIKDKKGDTSGIKGLLDFFPNKVVHAVSCDSPNLTILSRFLRLIVSTEWHVSNLSKLIQLTSQKSNEMGLSGDNDPVWRQKVASDKSLELFVNLSTLYRSSLFEVCRIRTDPARMKLDKERDSPEKRPEAYPKKFILRIVCQDGAIVRDGPEIDTCNSVGFLELGQIITATDRCINSSGIMRYRTTNGWISELTRGHGREPIAEVLWMDYNQDTRIGSQQSGRGVSDLCGAATTVLARMQKSFKTLTSTLGKAVIQGITRNLWGRTPEILTARMTKDTGSLLKALVEEILGAFNEAESCTKFTKPMKVLYLGNVLEIVNACLYEEKREKISLNLLLLVELLLADFSIEADNLEKPTGNITSALLEVFTDCLELLSEGSSEQSQPGSCEKVREFAINPLVSSALPPAIDLLQKMSKRVFVLESQLSSVLGRMKYRDLIQPIRDIRTSQDQVTTIDEDAMFSVDEFAEKLLCSVAIVSDTVLTNVNLTCVPSHILRPFLASLKDLVLSLKACADGKINAVGESNALPDGPSVERRSIHRLPLSLIRGGEGMNMNQATLGSFLERLTRGQESNGFEVFEPSEEAITHLMEMGFGREHALEALENTETNRVDVAMEYALTHPPPSPTTIERRRTQREARRSLREERDRLSQIQNEHRNTLADTDDDKNETSDPSAEDTNGENSEENLKDKINEVKLSKIKLDSMCSRISEVSVNLIEGQRVKSDTCMKLREADAETINVVICSFLLDLGKSFVDIKVMTWKLLQTLQEYLNVSKGSVSVLPGKESSVSSLTHGLVLLLKAAPRNKHFVLRVGLVSKLIKLLKSCCGDHRSRAKDVFEYDSSNLYPIWLPPVVLLLETMAQSTISPVEACKDDPEDAPWMGVGTTGKSEYNRIVGEHKKQAAVLKRTMSDLLDVLNGKSPTSKKKRGKGKKQGKSTVPEGSETDFKDEGQAEVVTKLDDKKEMEKDEVPNEALPLSELPTQLPMISPDDADQCMTYCFRILRSRFKDAKQLENRSPSGMVHAILLLLSRVLRSHKVATKFLRMGGVELLLHLPYECKFLGACGLLANILRHLLEDDQTLRTNMETEIRSVVMRLHRKNNSRSSSDTQGAAKISSAPFIEAVTPLICRQPIVFVKACATAVVFKKRVNGSAGLDIVLLSSEERSNRMKLLSDYYGTGNHTNSTPPVKKGKAQGSNQSSTKRKYEHKSDKSKPDTQSPNKRGKSPKRSKKFREKGNKSSDFIVLNGSPANHITSILLSKLLVANPSESSKKNKKHMIGLVDILDILSDLSLAVPACAASIHRFRPPSTSKAYKTVTSFGHAIEGCKTPSPTPVSYLLHKLLPLPRIHSTYTINNLQRLEKDKEKVEKRVREFHMVQISQKTARLLVILCARAGEGRRRVVNDLIRALFAENSESRESKVGKTEKELWALLSWADLCTGLCAPRAGRGQDNDSALSWEVVKLMLEFGIAHSLMNCVNRIDLNLPMSSTTAASLLKPLEIFTRSTVCNKVREMAACSAEDDKPKSGSGRKSEGTRRITFGPSQRSETAFADDAMIDDGFIPDDVPREVHDEGEILGMIEDIVNMSSDGSEDDTSDEEEESESEEDSSSEASGPSFDDSEVEMESVIGEESGIDSSSGGNSDDDSHSMSLDESAETMETASEINDGMLEVEDESDREFDEETIDDDDNDDESNEEPWEEEDLMLDNPEDFLQEETRGEENAGANDAAWIRRIEGGPGFPGGIGLVVRRGQGGGNVGRLLGNIFQGGQEVQLEALSELHDMVNIGSGGGGGGNPLRIPAGLSRVLASAREVIEDTERARPVNRGESNAVPGISPSVSQNNEARHIIPGGGMLRSEYIWMDYAYVYGSNERRSSEDFLSNFQEEREYVPASYNTQLFPNGPASSLHASSTLHVHALLADVTLPPMFSLSLFILPLGSRSRFTYVGEDSGSLLRGPTLSGNLYRLSGRSSPIGYSRSSRNTYTFPGTLSQSVNDSRWTDDFLSLGAVSSEFTSAFEQALSSMLDDRSSDSTELNQNNDSTNMVVDREENTGNDSSSEQDDAQEDAMEVENEEVDNIEQESINLREQPREMQAEAESAEQESVVSETASNTIPPNDLQRRGSSPPRTDGGSIGEAVASSLAEGLNITSTTNVSHQLENDDPNEQRDEGGCEQAQDTLNTSSNQNEEPVTETNSNEMGLVCPTGMDEEVFNALPIDMQQELVDQHTAASQIDGIDPDAFAALPDEMRREILSQQRTGSAQSSDPPADPANAEEMDNASFLASLAPDLRSEILLTADNDFLASLPPNIVAEAQMLRDRAVSQQSARSEVNADRPIERQSRQNSTVPQPGTSPSRPSGYRSVSSRRSNDKKSSKARVGHVKVDRDKEDIIFVPESISNDLGPFLTPFAVQSLIKLMYMLSPVRPHRLLQKLFLNISQNSMYRKIVIRAFVSLLNNDNSSAVNVISYIDPEGDRRNTKFPPKKMVGVPPDMGEQDIYADESLLIGRRRNTNATTASIAANIPVSGKGISAVTIPPIVARRMIDTLWYLTKSTHRTSIDILENPCQGDLQNISSDVPLNTLLDLLASSAYTRSSTNLEQLLQLIEAVLLPLSVLPKAGQVVQVTKKDQDAANAAGKEWMKVSRPNISRERINILCKVLRLESCKDASCQKVNTIAKRLSRVEQNRDSVLKELSSVIEGLGMDAYRDLKSLSIHLDEIVGQNSGADKAEKKESVAGIPPSVATLSTSSSEVKLLRALQTLYVVSADENIDAATKDKSSPLSISLNLGLLWQELSSCLRIVSVLEGVVVDESIEKDEEVNSGDDNVGDGDGDGDGLSPDQKLPSNVAGLLTRFLPAIESFFIVEQNQEQIVSFVGSNKVLLNGLLRANPALLDKSLKTMISTQGCKFFIDFDVKRQWFKTQMKRLRQSASRRYGNLRLSIRRKHVFEDAYHQLRLRTADEMRGRLQITFRDEEGVDAGGLSREFFEILAKEMFNPNYALFTSTEDGCTFQPNPHSSINHDHLFYFRFVGRIVGKAVSDGFLLDAHFTRSLYKHMLGQKPSHEDMQAIDPDYYKNLCMILEYNLDDIGLDHMTFSMEDHSFGRSATIDLIPNGRNVTVTEDNKKEYVSAVCQHRMTNSIEKQIKAYLEGFHELVQEDMISIFSAKELELLISGMPDIDMNDLQSNTEYQNYKPTDKEIRWFWNILHSFTRSQKAAFLQFVTGSSKVPLEGFSQLQGMRGTQKFCINKAGGSKQALPSAHTCFNALDLPQYESEEIMREKILYSINSAGSGFQFA